MTEAEEKIHLRNLIESQRHLFIEASAGSGKTTRLVNLIAEIILQEKAEISEILCVTFTEKAASELKARIYSKLRELPDAPARKATENFSLNAIGTIHSFCLRSLGLNKIYSLAQTDATSANDGDLFEEAREWVYREAWSGFDSDTLAEHLQASDFGSGGNNRSFDQALRSRALWCFSMNATPLMPAEPKIDAISTAEDFFNFTLAAIVRRMHEVAEASNTLSFSRMITLMAEAVKDNEFAAMIRGRLKYALIDEFQDTDEIQWHIFKKLFLDSGPKAANILVVVGDPKQAIYKFRGADVFVYLRAKSELLALGAQSDELTQNHRSTPDILNYLNAFFSDPRSVHVWARAQISYPLAGMNKKVVSTQDDCSGTEIWHADEHGSENTKRFCTRAAMRIAQIKSQQPDWTVAVIAFKHRTLAVMADALRDAGIEYAYYGEKPDLRRLDIEHLKVFVESFSHDLSQGLAQASATIFLHNRADALKYYENLSAMLHQGKIFNFLQTIAQNHKPLHLVLEYDGDPVQYHAWRTLFENLLARCGHDIVDFFTLRKAVARLKNRDAGEEARGDMLRSASAIQLLTVQSSKGLDWNVVVLADGDSDARWRDFPFFHNAAGQAVVPANIDTFDAANDRLMTSGEESQITQLNLLYVALTRAKHKLIVFTQPPLRAAIPGPTGAFFFERIRDFEQNATLINLDDAEAAGILPISAQNRTVHQQAGGFPMPVHADAALRILERKSFSSLSKAEFTPAEYADDILPRGTQIGQLLHTLLETCDFSDLKTPESSEAKNVLSRARIELEKVTLVETDLVEKVAARILEIIIHCANANLPLGEDQPPTRLSNLPSANLWREMPFWSSSGTHAVLRDMKPKAVSRLMHGYMDMVFSPNDLDYYILDYKSNSLAGLASADLDAYIDSHYALQREIYGEALQSFLQKLYPNSGRRVRGCYFLFLRYLKSGETTGVQFREYAHG